MCDGPVEGWLQNVVDSMKAALAAEFKRCARARAGGRAGGKAGGRAMGCIVWGAARPDLTRASSSRGAAPSLTAFLAHPPTCLNPLTCLDTPTPTPHPQQSPSAMPTYDEVPRTSWILRYSAQATVAVSRTFFTQEVGEAFEELEEGNEDALKAEYERQVGGWGVEGQRGV
jgi:hypothetical protein